MKQKKSRRDAAKARKDQQSPTPTPVRGPQSFPPFPLAAVLVVACLWVPWGRGTDALPLDDAYIHLAVVRQLLEEGTWGLPGVPWTAVSTAPAWVLLLVPIRLLLGDAVISAQVASILSAVAVTGMSILLARELRPKLSPVWDFATAVAVITAAPVLWSGLSGMETLAAASLGTGSVLAFFRGQPVLAAGIAGALVGFRPEGVLLVAVVLLLTALDPVTRHRLPHAILAGTLALAPWIALNLVVSGSPLPGTYAAKVGSFQAERGAFLSGLFTDYLIVPFWVGLLFLVRFEGWALLGYRRMALWLWPLAHIVAFAVLLPGSYQHYRYLVPVLPLLTVLGARGLAVALRQPLASKGVAYGLIFVTTFFGYQMWGTLAENQRDIRALHGQVADFIREDGGPGAVLADDLGYLAWSLERPVADLRGLALPELNVAALKPALVAAKAPFPVGYVVLYPDLYAPGLLPDDWRQVAIFRTRRTIVAADTLAVYRREVPSGDELTGPDN